jgi:hypothetical protein
MTQAFNLSQLANKVNTSGQLDASTGLVNITPVANGGTGRSSVTAGRLLVGAGTSNMALLAGAAVDDVVTWSGTAWISAAAAGGAAPTVDVFSAPGTWTKPGTIKGIKVTVIGGGGTGGASTLPTQPAAGGGGGGGGTAIEFIAAPALPGPVAVTAGAGTNSFGAFCSATAGATAGVSPGKGANGGSGSGGSINFGGSDGGNGFTGNGGMGGSSSLGGGGSGAQSTGNSSGSAGNNYGGGGGGAVGVPPAVGGAGAPGIVIIEEFY